MEEILRIGSEMAEGLAAAHQRGLIHRDIKPANIWLERPRDRVKILDFGLARANEPSQKLTHSGVVMGTPAYMSPEQARGVNLDGRSDLFSLGCVLYQMTTGIRPFDGPTFIATLLNIELHHPPAVHEVNPSIPMGLSNLIMQLIAKKADDRPASAQEVSDRLRQTSPEQISPAFFPAASSFSPEPISPAFFQASSPSPTFPTLQPRATPLPPRPAVSLPGVSPRSVTPNPVAPPSLLPTSAPVVRESNDYPVVNRDKAPAWDGAKHSGGGWFVKFLFFLLLLGGGGYFAYSEFLDRGTLLIDSDDEKAEVEISFKGVPKYHSIAVRQFELRPGTYNLNLIFSSPGAQMDKHTVNIQRGKTESVKIRR